MIAREDNALLEARIEDGLHKADKGSVASLLYLTPYEQKVASRLLKMRGMLDRAFFFGGYEGAERKSLFLLPEYLSGMLSVPLPETPTEEVLGFLSEDVQSAMCAVLIRGSGFRKLTHRDYLGSILNLGIKRESLGDLCVQDDRSAVLFCTPTLSSFLKENLERVANDVVKQFPYEVDAAFTDGRQYQEIRDTVSAPRLDCVIAALTNLSRSDAQDLVRSGTVEVDFEPEDRTDLLLSPPMEISARGFGRFRLVAFDGTTKKDRLRLVALKYV